MVLTGPVIRRRLALCMAVFILLLTVLGGRLFWLQVIGGRALQQRAQSQWTSESTIRPARGRILDRKGAVLAQSATAYTAAASPRQVVDPARFATLLSPVLDMEAAVIQRKVSDTSRGGVTLKRQLPRETAQQLKRMKAEKAIDALEKEIPGIRDQIERYYTSTPLTYLDYTGTPNGSMYGMAKDVNAPGTGSVSCRTNIPNLLLTGQSITSHGMLGVLAGSLVTCSEVLTTDEIFSQLEV